MRPTKSAQVCALVFAVGLFGCDTSSHDVIIEPSADNSDPRSLSVAWGEMEQRLLRLETDVQLARDETRRLCLDESSSHPVCSKLATADRRLADLGASVETIDSSVDTIDQRVGYNERTLSPLSYDAKTKSVTFTGVNVQIRNGTRSTDGEPDGTGNLIVGWNEADDNDARTGSHNIIVGSFHAWDGHSGIAVGTDHALLNAGGAAIGGEANTVAGNGAVLIGGQDNQAFGPGSAGIGGAENRLAGPFSTFVSGLRNDAEGSFSLVIGGADMAAVDDGSVVLETAIGPNGEVHPNYAE